MPGLVPEVEEREAALFNGYTWREWGTLDYFDRVDGVAHFRIHHLLALVRSEVEAVEIEKRNRRAT
jgi:hypothetical protein